MFLKTQGLDHDLYVCLDNGILKKTNGEKRMTVNKKIIIMLIANSAAYAFCRSTCKMRNETRNETCETERNEIYQNETKRNVKERNKMKRNETTPCLSLTYTEGFPKWANRGANVCPN